MGDEYYSKPRKVWDVISPLVMFAIAIIIVSFGVSAVLSSIFMRMGYSDSVIDELVKENSIYTSLVFYAVGILFGYRKFKKDRYRLGEIKFRWKVWMAVPACAVVFGIGVGLNYLIDAAGLQEIFSYYSDTVNNYYVGKPVILLIAVLGVLGPVAEEIIFRGLIYERLRSYIRPSAAMIISGVIFGIYHANVVQFIYASVMGIFLALIYEKSRSLAVPMIAHIAINIWSLHASFF